MSMAGNGHAGATESVQSDAAEILDSFNRFLIGEAAPLYERPEYLPDRSRIARLIESAENLGFLPGKEPTGLGLWEQLEPFSGLGLSVQYLDRLAAYSAGLAYLFHSRALVWFAGNRLEACLEPSTVFLLPVARGMGRGALAEFLGEHPLSVHGRTNLKPLFVSRDEPFDGVLQAGQEPACVVVPELSPNTDGVLWARLPQSAYNLKEVSDTLGLDEIRTWKIRVEPGTRSREAIWTNPVAGLDLYRKLFSLELLGQMAIATGTIRTAIRKARAYSGERRQGGKLISHHPAIHRLIGESEASLITAETALQSVSASPLMPRRLMALRAVLHPLLCQAATNCLQVFGGYGYMRDYGMEKILRDNQQIKIMAGSPSDISLSLGAEETQ